MALMLVLPVVVSCSPYQQPIHIGPRIDNIEIPQQIYLVGQIYEFKITTTSTYQQLTFSSNDNSIKFENSHLIFSPTIPVTARTIMVTAKDSLGASSMPYPCTLPEASDGSSNSLLP